MKKVVILTNVRKPENPTALYIQADKIVSWSRAKNGKNTEVSVETVPFPFIVSETPDEILAMVQEENR